MALGNATILGPEELRLRLGVSRHAAYGLARRIGQLVGGRWVVSERQLVEWIRSQVASPKAIEERK